MRRLKSFWDNLEAAVFHYKIKRAVSVAVFFIGIQALIYVAMVWWLWGIPALAVQTAAGGQIASAVNGALVLSAAGIFLAILAGWLVWAMLPYLAVKPLKQVDALFLQLADGRADLSRDMAQLPYAELSHLSEGYNRFIGNIREIIENIRKTGVNIAIGSTRVRKSVEQTGQKTNRQKQLSELVSVSSDDATGAINEVSQNAQYVSSNTGANLEKARESYKELVAVADKLDQINRTVQTFRQTVEELNRNSSGIMEIVGLINNISDQTNLLSLNATIEAARAGEHGKGFAVVAEEVRTLAKRVKPATEDITDKVNKMIQTVEKTISETNQIVESGTQVSTIVNQTAANFESMIGAFEGTNDQLLKIAAAIEELSLSNTEINQKVREINDLTVQIDSEMEASGQTVQGLNQVTEKMQEMVSHYTTGQGVLDEIISRARGHRDSMQERIAAMVKQGVNVFDHNYRAVLNTNPAQFTASFTQAFNKAFQSFCDSIVKEISGAIYALPVDCKGYLPLHHSQFSKPQTGDYSKDVLYSRDRRIYFSNQTEVRRATNKDPMLLQTYMRDTGEVINDLSMPIFIDGRHWGSFILGLNPDIFMK